MTYELTKRWRWIVRVGIVIMIASGWAWGVLCNAGTQGVPSPKSTQEAKALLADEMIEMNSRLGHDDLSLKARTAFASSAIFYVEYGLKRTLETAGEQERMGMYLLMRWRLQIYTEWLSRIATEGNVAADRWHAKVFTTK